MEQYSLFKSLKQRIKNKQMNNRISEYPCVDYLHNALLFIDRQDYHEAYDEICWAITKSGGQLTGMEHHKRWTACSNSLPKEPGNYDVMIQKVISGRLQTVREFCTFKYTQEWDCPPYVEVVAWREI